MGTLRFNSQGTFKIVQFTDLHCHDGDAQDERTYRLLHSVLANERPDFVVFTGDVIESTACTHPIEAFRKVVRCVDDACTPWAVVFGNHDAETGDFDNADLLNAVLDLPYCRAQRGPADVHGVGNYRLDVLSPDGVEVDHALFFFDSGRYAPPRIGGYDWVHIEQIEWYRQASDDLAKRAGHVVPALAFFHIPFPEYRDVWEMAVCYGNKLESVCSPQLNTGLFAAMVEQGDVTGVFVGHDHLNDYWGEWFGVRLCYGLKSGYHNYPSDETFNRGARVIELKAGDGTFSSWLRFEDGRVLAEQAEHKPSVDTE